MNERKKLIDCFLNALTGHILWIQKYPVKENEYTYCTINDNDNEFSITSYHDGSMSLDREGYVTHMAYVDNVDKFYILLDSYLAAHGFEGFKEGDL